MDEQNQMAFLKQGATVLGHNLSLLHGNATVKSCANLTADDTWAESGSGQKSLLTLVNIYYGIVYLVGMCGNFLVLWVVCRYSRMHTVTNFFILSLALADICFLVNVPFLMVTTFMESWIFGDLYCKVFYSMTTVNQFASSFFLLVMSADRYFAVCHAIRSNQYRTANAAIIVCSAIWVTSIILMIPVFIYSGDIYDGACMIHWPGTEYLEGMQAFTLYCLILGFAFPLILIVAFYTMVLRKLRTLGPKNVQIMSETRKKSHRKVTIMVLAVITAYIVCWLPYWIAQVILVYTDIISQQPTSPTPADGQAIDCQAKAAKDAETRKLVTGIVVVLQALCYTSSSINPILYAMLSENFKKSFVAACCCRRSQLAIPEPSIYQRSRFLTASIRRKFLNNAHADDHEDELEEEEEEERGSPDTGKTNVSAARRPTNCTEITNSLHAPITRNGSSKSAMSNHEGGNRHSNGYRLVTVRRDDDEDAV